MPTDSLVTFMQGATAMGCLALAVVFLRFWKRSGDRLFAIFSMAFAIFALNRVLLGPVAGDETTEAVLYVMRALVFALIFLAILDKNRAPTTKSTAPVPGDQRIGRRVPRGTPATSSDGCRP